MPRPRLIVCCRTGSVRVVLSQRLKRNGFRAYSSGGEMESRNLSGLKNLSQAQGLITTWDSPHFAEELARARAQTCESLRTAAGK